MVRPTSAPTGRSIRHPVQVMPRMTPAAFGDLFPREGSKVSSASRMIILNGHVLAVPFSPSSSSVNNKSTLIDNNDVPSILGKATPRPMSASRVSGSTSRTSEYGAQFRNTPACFSTMGRKPLSVYNPNAMRNRNRQVDAIKPNRNTSNVRFDDGIHASAKRRFWTTQRTYHNGAPLDLRSNQGTISEETRWVRRMCK